MKRKYTPRIDPKIKSEAIEMLQNSDYSVTEVSRAYGISRSTLNAWRSALNDSNRGAEGFVEVAVLDSKKTIKKASMVFDKMSFSIEGEINSSCLVSVIKILEAS